MQDKSYQATVTTLRPLPLVHCCHSGYHPAASHPSTFGPSPPRLSNYPSVQEISVPSLKKNRKRESGYFSASWANEVRRLHKTVQWANYNGNLTVFHKIGCSSKSHASQSNVWFLLRQTPAQTWVWFNLEPHLVWLMKKELWVPDERWQRISCPCQVRRMLNSVHQCSQQPADSHVLSGKDNKNSTEETEK